MNPKQILQILRLRWMLVLACVILAGSGTTYFTLQLPKIYTSQTSLLLDVKADPLVATFMPNITTPAFFATQAHIIKSDKVAAAVVRNLGLEKSPDALLRWRIATGGKVPLATFYANMMQKGLIVEPAPGTNVLNISFGATDPKFASMVANAYAQAYIDFSVDLRVEPARNYATWFDGQLKKLRAELEEAQTRLSTAQQQKGILSTDGRLDNETGKLNALVTQLADTQFELTQNAARARNSGLESSPDAQASVQVQNLKQQLAKLQADFADAGNQLGEQHPKYQSLRSQIRVTEEQLSSEMRKVMATSNTLSRVSSEKVSALTAQIEAQKNKVLNLRGGRDDVEVLVKDVETAQRAYEAVANRRAQLYLESQSEQAAARILSVAVEALAPTSRAPVHIMMGILGGLGVGCLIALGLEFLDRRVRSPDDLLAIEGIPVLAVLDHKASLVLALKPRGIGQTAVKLLGLKGS